MKVIAPMAGICNSDFLLKLIPYGFNTVTLGGYNIDEKSIAAGEKIIERGRKEFNYPLEDIFSHIESESKRIKENSDVKVSCNLRSCDPKNIIKVSKIKSVDIVEINCHCRQEELTSIGCGQSMLSRLDLEDYINTVVANSKSEVSVKIRGNVEGVNNLDVAGKIEDAGADYIHVDAMKLNHGADLDLIREISENTNLYIIGNNSIKSLEDCRNMLDSGANGISIGRATIKGSLDFDLNQL